MNFNNIIKRTWKEGRMVNIEDLSGVAFQAESGGHSFWIYGEDENGEPIELSGTPAGVMLRADNQDVALNCSVVDGMVIATLPQNAYSVPGRFGITVYLTGEWSKTAIYAAVGTVTRTSSGTIAPPAGADVVTLVNSIATAVAAIPVGYNASFAPAYSASSVYAVGQYVTYNGTLYRCTTAITSGETWNADHWTAATLGNDVSDLKSATDNGLYDIKGKLTNIQEDYYSFDDVAWEQGSFNSSGNTESSQWIRTGLIPGGFMIHNTNPKIAYIVGRVNDGTGAVGYKWMSSAVSDEWYYIPYDEGYHVKIRQKFTTSSTDIVPAQNSLKLYRPTDDVTDGKNGEEFRKIGIVRIDGVEAVKSTLTFEQGSYTNEGADSDSYLNIRSGWFSGGVYLVNPDRLGFYVLIDDGSTKSYMSFSSAVSGASNCYDDALAFIPRLKVGQYRIRVRNFGSGTNMYISPEQSTLGVYAPVENRFTLGAVASGGYSYSLSNVLTDGMELDGHIGIRFRLVDSDYRFAVYSTANGTSYRIDNGGWQNQGESIVFESGRTYVCRIGAKTGVTFDYDDATQAIRIEYVDEIYGYTRHYTNIGYSLQWQHKTMDLTDGIVDSTTNLLAEIPSRGSVELKMNHTYTNFAFAVWKIAGNGTISKLQDWTHYFFRYLPDEGAECHYYVTVRKGNNDELTNAVTGLRGLRIYTYEDEGKAYSTPSPFYGKRVAVMGDSIVQGRYAKDAESVNNVHSKPWPVLIAEKSNTQPADFGIGGSTVYGDTWDTLYTNRNAIQGYDVVLVCAGTNDYGAAVSEENFKTAYEAVLTALAENNTKVYAVTPTRRVQDISTTNRINLTLTDYANFIRTVAASMDIPVIDLYAMTRSHAMFINSMTDGLHPNESGQRIIADLILENVPD